MGDDTERFLLAGIGAIDGLGIASIDAGGRVTSWNAGAERLTGRRSNDAIAASFGELLADQPRESIPGYLEALSEAGGEHTVWLRRTNGQRFWAHVSASSVRANERTPDAFVVVFRDATALRAAHDEVERSRTMFEGILAIASDAVISVDESQRIIFFNEGAERTFGYSRDEALGHPLEMLIPERLRFGHADDVREFGRASIPARQMGDRGEISGLRSNGEVFPAEASISKLEVAGGTIYTAVLRDVTERRRAQEALRHQAEDLARSNADLEQFAYVASHDLQEPLRMVASYTQLLARRYRGQLDEDADEFIGFAVDGVNRMQALINDLLAYSRVGRKGSEFVAVPMGTLLDRVINTMRPSLDETDAAITRDDLPSVSGEQTQLYQLLQNLIQNGVKFHRPGVSPRIHVGADDLGDSWRFHVQDNGIGIPPEFRDRIFVIFQRLHSRDEYAGTGIGLAICKKIVERHRGRIWVEDNLDGGCTFFFTLPKDAVAE